MIIEVLIDIAPEFGCDDPGGVRAMAINPHVLVCEVARTRRCRTIVGFEASITPGCCVLRIRVCESVLLRSQASHSISESRPGSPGRS